MNLRLSVDTLVDITALGADAVLDELKDLSLDVVRKGGKVTVTGSGIRILSTEAEVIDFFDNL